MGGEHQLVLAAMEARRDPGRPADQAGEMREGLMVRGQRRRREFEIARRQNARRAEEREPVAIQRALRMDRGEPAEDHPRGARRHLPACKAAGGEAGVDEHERNAALRRRAQDIGPDLAFHEGRRIGPPMIEETRDPGRHVERDEAVDDAVAQGQFGQPLRQQTLGRDSARGQQDGSRLLRQNREHGQDGDGLAEARCMQPDQPAGGARGAVDRLPLRQTGGDLAPARDPTPEHDAQARGGDAGEACPKGEG